MIPFNKPCLSGNELRYIKSAVKSGHISGDGLFTRKCHEFFKQRYGFEKVMLTNSCTDALEMSAILIDIKPGDEIILPSYTFVSTANAFLLRGAKLRFVDSTSEHPNMDTKLVERLITSKTKAIIPVHYAGMSCNMDDIMAIATKFNLFVIEDAAQAIDSYYKNKPLGSFGNMATFSFHESKNIISGEGGMLVINDKRFEKRAEIIREKGTNRSSFFRGEINKYGWVDIGSSFLPSDIIAAYLYAQLENIDKIQKKRTKIWNTYCKELSQLEKKGLIKLPTIPKHASNNAHIFYIMCNSLKTRTALIQFLKNNGIMAVFHYQSLYHSPFFKKNRDSRKLPNAQKYSDCLLRLPLYYGLSINQANSICDVIKKYFTK